MTGGPAPFRLRAFGPQDIPAARALAAEFGWPHRVDDLRFMLFLGHGIAATDESGEVVGCGAWWAYGPEAGTLGLVMVAPALQGRGLGRRMIRHLLAEAGPRRLTLIATEAGRPLYEREGFGAVGDLGQYQGIVAPPSAEPPQTAGHIRPFAPRDLTSVTALDAAAHAGDRSHLVAALAATATGWVHEVDGRVAGFAFARPFGRGHLVGPLVAEGDEAALALLRPALEARAGRFLRLDTPRREGDFARHLEAAGLVLVDVAVTMVRGDALADADGPARSYAIASQALG